MRIAELVHSVQETEMYAALKGNLKVLYNSILILSNDEITRLLRILARAFRTPTPL